MAGKAASARIQKPAVAPFVNATTNRVPESVSRILADSGTPLPIHVRGDMETRFGHDFSQVRIHLDKPAAESAHDIQARAYTLNNHIVFGTDQYAPQSSTGRQLLAHELAHVIQPSGNTLRRAPSKGESMTDAADKWIQSDSAIKVEVDKLKAALKEMKQGKNLAFNKKAGAPIIDTLAKLVPLNATKTAELKKNWEWLADNSKNAKASIQQKQKSLLGDLQSPLSQVSQQHPKSQAKFWLKNTPSQVADLLYAVADSDLPVEELYVYAAREGMIQLVRDQLGLGKTDDPSKAQLKAFDTSKKVDGFDYLGADDFMTELDAKRDPMRNFLPKGYDLGKVKEVKHTNEKNREVRSAEFPNLSMALQGLAATLKRRRKLFLEDAKANKYATPTREELVYWTYVYFNTGEFGGKAQLAKYQGKRKLFDWIAAKEYPNSMVVLDSYKMLKSMDSKAKIF